MPYCTDCGGNGCTSCGGDGEINEEIPHPYDYLDEDDRDVESMEWGGPDE